MDGRGKTILVAEDDESNRNLLALLLQQEQYEVHLAADGYEALDCMLKGVFDAVMTDWHMPRLNGSQFLALSRILWPDIPVIIVSAQAFPSAQGIPQGAFAWIKKPYESKYLLRVLHAATQTAAPRYREQSIMPSRQHR
jgi:two-component system, chemotaxis family, chemotaxis protein CheY